MVGDDILTEETWEHSLFEQTESQSTEEVPRLAEFREAVDHIIDVRNGTLIKLVYLGAYRMSEVLAHVNPYEKEHNQTKAYGKSLVWKTTDFKADAKLTVKTLLLRSAVAKRTKTVDGKPQFFFKTIALPLVPVMFEPWAGDLMRWVHKWRVGKDALYLQRTIEKKCSDPRVVAQAMDKFTERALQFNVSRPTVETIIRKELGRFLPDKSKHTRKNWLRHVRLTHLRQNYDFNEFDLTAFAGWTLGSGMAGRGASGMLDTYVHTGWESWYPKLLKPLTEAY